MKPSTWIARGALAVFLLFALVGALDPRHDVARLAFGSDEWEHAAISFVLVLLVATAFPAASLWLIAVGLAAGGLAFETAQWMGWVSGGFELSDWIADVAGILAALAPIAVLQLRSRPTRRGRGR